MLKSKELLLERRGPSYGRPPSGSERFEKHDVVLVVKDNGEFEVGKVQMVHTQTPSYTPSYVYHMGLYGGMEDEPRSYLVALPDGREEEFKAEQVHLLGRAARMSAPRWQPRDQGPGRHSARTCSAASVAGKAGSALGGSA